MFQNYQKHIFLFCKNFAAISLASSVQVTLKFYFQILTAEPLIKLSLN